MTPESAARAARLLIDARRGGEVLPALPSDCAPRDADEGYAVQAAFVEASGEDVAGYKVGATSEPAQRALGLDAPFWGRVPAGGVHASPVELPGSAYTVRVVEPEFAFRLGASLGPDGAPFDRESVAAVVAAVHPAMELVASAFGPDWKARGGPAVIADNGVHGGLVLGPAWGDWQNLDLARHVVRLAVNGAPASRGDGSKVFGDPILSLVWLANELARHGLALAAGDVVTTGVVTDPVSLAPGDRALADFGPLGEVRIGFAG